MRFDIYKWKNLAVLLCAFALVAACSKKEDSPKPKSKAGQVVSAPMQKEANSKFANTLKAAEQGSIKAQHALGTMYAGGNEVSQDFVQASKWLRKAAEQGHRESQAFLATFYIKGVGVSKNPQLGMKWMRKAAEQGQADAQYIVGAAYVNGEYGFSTDYKKAAIWQRKAAEQGHANAQYNLALMHKLGKGADKDPIQAYKWFSLSAVHDKDNQQAEKQLNEIAAQMSPEQIQKAKALVGAWKPFLETAKKGDIKAQFSQGLMYYRGEGVEQDYVQAAKWFKLAANQKHAKAAFMLGLMHSKGEGFSQNYRQAVLWYQKSAEQGLARAQNIMGANYAQGKGVLQDYGKAIYWFNKAAEQGYALAQFSLGGMYSRGDGVAQSYVEAHKWYSLAVSGYPKAEGFRNHIESMMNPSQIKRAMDLAEKWKEAH